MNDQDRPLIDIKKIENIVTTIGNIYELIYRDNYEEYEYLKIIQSELTKVQDTLKTRLEQLMK